MKRKKGRFVLCKWERRRRGESHETTTSRLHWKREIKAMSWNGKKRYRTWTQCTAGNGGIEQKNLKTEKALKAHANPSTCCKILYCQSFGSRFVSCFVVLFTVFLYTQLYLHHWEYLRSKVPLNMKTGVVKMA